MGLDEAKSKGDTLGGIFEVAVHLGRYEVRKRLEFYNLI